MIFDIIGHCHTCGKEGEPKRGQTGRLKGIPFCSERCEKRAAFGVGDTVVLDSGYTPGENGVPFKVQLKDGSECHGRVRGKKVRFHESMAAKVGTKRAEAICNQRKLLNAMEVFK
jgi:hypothetical protein